MYAHVSDLGPLPGQTGQTGRPGRRPARRPAPIQYYTRIAAGRI